MRNKPKHMTDRHQKNIYYASKSQNTMMPALDFQNLYAPIISSFLAQLAQSNLR